MAWGSWGLLPHPLLQMQKTEGWAGLGLGWELAALSLWMACFCLRQAEMSCCHLVTRSCRDPYRTWAIDLTAVLIKALDIPPNSFSQPLLQPPGSSVCQGTN